MFDGRLLYSMKLPNNAPENERFAATGTPMALGKGGLQR
jgi:hypothetical protein